MQFFVIHLISKLLVILKNNGEKYEGIPLMLGKRQCPFFVISLPMIWMLCFPLQSLG